MDQKSFVPVWPQFIQSKWDWIICKISFLSNTKKPSRYSYLTTDMFMLFIRLFQNLNWSECLCTWQDPTSLELIVQGLQLDASVCTTASPLRQVRPYRKNTRSHTKTIERLKQNRVSLIHSSLYWIKWIKPSQRSASSMGWQSRKLKRNSLWQMAPSPQTPTSRTPATLTSLAAAPTTTAPVATDSTSTTVITTTMTTNGILRSTNK